MIHLLLDIKPIERRSKRLSTEQVTTIRTKYHHVRSRDIARNLHCQNLHNVTLQAAICRDSAIEALKVDNRLYIIIGIGDVEARNRAIEQEVECRAIYIQIAIECSRLVDGHSGSNRSHSIIEVEAWRRERQCRESPLLLKLRIAVSNLTLLQRDILDNDIPRLARRLLNLVANVRSKEILHQRIEVKGLGALHHRNLWLTNPESRDVDGIIE